jgi:branched-chain amino acid aminotransferase
MDSFKEKAIIYKDGEYYSEHSIGMDFSSQTIHYGYGAFEGIRAYQTENGTKIFKAKEHFERLKSSCEQIYIPFKWDINQLVKDTYKLLEANDLKNAYIRPLVYTESGLFMGDQTSTHLLITAWPFDSYYGDKLLKTMVSSYEKGNPHSSPTDAKITGNYINSVLALSEAKRKGLDEAILLDMYGYVAESSSANIFIEKNGKLYTPEKGNIISGITRNTVMQIAKQLDIEVEEKKIFVNDLKTADAAFLTGTAAEIAGIQSVDDYVFPINFSDSIGSAIQRVYKKIVLDKLSFEVII